MDRTMYKPKESLRWRPKIPKPIKLEDFCLNAAVDLLLRTSERLSRNIREKKAIREFVSRNLPQLIQQKVVQHVVERLSGVQTSMNLLELFEPGFVIRESLDLLGPFRMGFGAYEKDQRLTWSQGSAKKFNLSCHQLEQLYNLMIWSNPSNLEEISISIARDTIKLTKFPNILARAKSLTRVTLLSGAENHTLRILGINCPNLKFLDVSHSVRLTDTGLQSLFLKRFPRRRSSLIESPAAALDGVLPSTFSSVQEEDDKLDTNPCASSIVCITLLGTSITWDGCENACRLMNFGYLHSFLPLVKIIRIGKDGLVNHASPFGNQWSEDLPEDTLKNQVAAWARYALPVDDLSELIMDHFRPQIIDKWGRRLDEKKSLVFLRKKDSHMLSLHMKIDSSFVTSLVLPWYTFTWRLDNIMDLDTIGMNFPNLKFLRARIKGIWHNEHKILLPHLEEAYIWSLNSATGLSILRNAPALQRVELNNTQTLAVNVDEQEINDEALEESLYRNETLLDNLKELTIRPADLCVSSLFFLTGNCPNLERIGDLESWNVTPEDIANFNRYLDTIGSQCVLTIMNFPPSSRDKTGFL